MTVWERFACAVLVGLVTLAGVAHAKEATGADLVYIEPSLGFAMGTLSGSQVDVITNSQGESKNLMGAALGARLGGLFDDYLFIGLDIRYVFASLAGTNTSDSKTTGIFNLGFGVGGTAEYIPLRWYLSLDALNSSKLGPVNLTTGGIRVGIGYHLTLGTILNVDFQTANHSGVINGASTKIQQSVLTFSLSWPLAFDYPDVPWKMRYGK